MEDRCSPCPGMTGKFYSTWHHLQHRTLHALTTFSTEYTFWHGGLMRPTPSMTRKFYSTRCRDSTCSYLLCTHFIFNSISASRTHETVSANISTCARCHICFSGVLTHTNLMNCCKLLCKLIYTNLYANCL